MINSFPRPVQRLLTSQLNGLSDSEPADEEDQRSRLTAQLTKILFYVLLEVYSSSAGPGHVRVFINVNEKCLSNGAGTFACQMGQVCFCHLFCTGPDWTCTPNSVTTWAGTEKPAKTNRLKKNHFPISRDREPAS